MLPKSRKAPEPDSEPEHKRRVTRSSTKTTALPKQDPLADTPRTKRAESGRKTETKSAKSPEETNGETRVAVGKATSEDIDGPEHQEATSTASKIITLTITSDLVKKPIECHQYVPASPANATPSTLIFTHGAGGTLSAPAVTHFCTGFSSLFPVLAFQGSMNLGSRVKGFHACIPHIAEARKKMVAKTKQKGSLGTMLLGGRSMGARAAVMAAQEAMDGVGSGVQPKIRLILVSYPLVGPKGKDDLRDRLLLDLPETVRVLFIVGDRDAMCPLDMLNETRDKMKAKSQLVVAKGADHGMHVVPKDWTEAMGQKSGRVAAAWLQDRLSGADLIYVGGDVEDDW